MKITIISAAFMAATAFAAPLARRAVAFTNDAYAAAVGTSLTINWAGASGAVTINLKSGEPDNLQTTSNIASNIWGTSTTWTPSATGTYALEIIDESGAINYSSPFWVSGSSVARREPTLAPRSPRFSLSRWLLDQPQLSKEQRPKKQRITSQRNEHLTRRQGKPTETENKLKEHAMKKSFVKVPDWKEIMLAPINALGRAIASPWTKVADETNTKEQDRKPAPVTVVVGPKKEVVVTKGSGAGQVEVKETFTQGDGWKGDNYRHGTWTSESKDSNNNQDKPE